MERLFGSIERFGARTAVILPDGGVMDHATLAQRADVLAAPLAAAPGLLALEAANDLEPLLALVGACRAGCPVLLLGEGDLAARPALQQTFDPEWVFRRGMDGWRLQAAGAGPRIPFHPDLALLLSTSGSTGSAKLVRLSHANLRANAASIIDYLGITGDDRAVTALPLQYSFGLSIVTTHLEAGASLVLTADSVLDPSFAGLLRRHGVTSLSGVPRTWEILVRNGFLDEPLPALRTLAQAGGRLAPELVARLARWAGERRARFFVMYGQTEAAPRMAWLPPGRAATEPDCIGLAVPGGRFHLEDADGRTIDQDGIAGELCFTGPNVMMGYALARADLALPQGPDLLRTGDIAERRPGGLYRIVGRASRFVKLAGLRVALDEIEALLRRRGVDACAAGSDDGLVVGVTDAVADPAALQAALVSELKIPAGSLKVAVLPALPYLPTGKPDYQAVLRLAATAADTPQDEGIRGILARILDRADLQDHETFLSAGGDSLSFVEGSLAVEDHFGRAVPGWDRIPIGDLERMDEAALAAGRPGFDPLLVARSVAIGLALASHALLQTGMWRLLPPGWRLLTRAATPAFLVIFGVGLARAFLDRPEARRPRAVLRRMLPKAAIIYGAMALTQAAAVVGGKSDPAEFLQVLAFSAPGRLVDVLMIYGSLYLLAPWLVALLARWRIAGLAAAMAVPWLLRPWLLGVTDAPYVAAYLTGAAGLVGPSVMHATTFVLFGYALGAARQRAFAAAAAVTAVLAVLVLGAQVAGDGLHVTVRAFADMSLRRTNDPAYYAFGMLTAAGLLAVARAVGRLPLPQERWAPLFGLGANSIFAFTFGNAVLNLLPAGSLPFAAGLGFTAAFLATLALLTHDIMRREPRYFGPVARLLRMLLQGSLRTMRAVSNPRRTVERRFPEA